MKNRFRLTSTNYERETEEQKIKPQKIFYLSVEGNITEKEYFNGISKYREKLGIDFKVNVIVLNRGRKDTNSAPKDILELLEEYLRLRELGSDEIIKEIPEDFLRSYGENFIKKYIRDPESCSKKERNRFITDLKKIGYDINYRKFLKTYENEDDEYGILIDRDIQTHSESNMLECIRYCSRKNYKCYIANPCFEFWLLLHLVDVRTRYQGQLDDILLNRKISRQHTFVSKAVSDIAHHCKGDIKFEINYLPNVDLAVERAKLFEVEEERLVDNLGCNLWKLIDELRKTI